MQCNIQCHYWRNWLEYLKIGSKLILEVGVFGFQAIEILVASSFCVASVFQMVA